MKKLSVLAIALAATCMFSGCGKETKQNVQPAEETYKNTESETSEECAAAQEEFSEEVVDTEESIDDEWTDEASELDEESRFCSGKCGYRLQQCLLGYVLFYF